MKQPSRQLEKHMNLCASGKPLCHATGAILVAIGILQFTAAAAVFNVNNHPSQFSLYTDPNTGDQIRLGGFSGLFPVPGDDTGRLFYTITDRGPSLDHPNGDDKVFPRPDYFPSIITVRLNGNAGVPGIGGNATILRVLALTKPDGRTVTGLPNPCLADTENAFDVFLNPIAGDSDGLDAEALSIDAEGNFWSSEEYRPSVFRINPDGVVTDRFVPKGTLCGDEVIATKDVLPKVLVKRRPNRGLESVAAVPNGLVYSIMQRPLMNPNRATSNTSRNIRIVEIDVAAALAGATEGVTRQLLYITEVTDSQANTYASDMFPMGDNIFLVTERRTDKLFAIDISEATDITSFEDEDGNLLVPVGEKTTLEQLTVEELAGLGIVPASKLELLPSLIALDPALEKSEGLAVSGGNIVLCPDNDFNLTGLVDESTLPVSIILQEPSNQPKLIVVPLPEF